MLTTFSRLTRRITETATDGENAEDMRKQGQRQIALSLRTRKKIRKEAWTAELNGVGSTTPATRQGWRQRAGDAGRVALAQKDSGSTLAPEEEVTGPMTQYHLQESEL